MRPQQKKLAANFMKASSLALVLAALAACGNSQSPDTLLSEARQFHQKGDDKAAIIQLKNALQQKPDDAEARYLLGTIYIANGDAASAEKEIRKALSLGMGPERTMAPLGRALLAQGQFQKVLDEVKPGATPDAAIEGLRGDALLGLGKIAEARGAFERAQKIQPEALEVMLGLARVTLAEKNPPQALQLAEQAIAKHPASHEAVMLKAELLRIQGKDEAALATYADAIKLKPDLPGAYLSKAHLEIGMRKFEQAKADIDSARKLTPNAPNLFYTQSLLDYSQGRHAAALESIQQVLRVAPEHLPSNLLAGAIQHALGSYPQAEQHLKKFVEQNPRNQYALKLLASTQMKNGQPQRALDTLQPALKNAPQDTQLLTLAGEASMQAREFPKATEYFERASATAPKTALIHTALGMSSLAQGENERAISELELATSLDPKAPQAGLILLNTHLRNKEYDKALALAQKLEQEQKDNPIVPTLKGNALLGKGKRTEARASFEKAVALQATYFPAVAALAQLDLLDKKPEEAKKRFEAVLAKDKKNVPALHALAKMALAEKKTEEGIALLERASNDNPDQVQPAVVLGVHYLRTGAKEKAQNLVQKLQVSHPDNAEVLDLLAQVQLSQGNSSAAIDTYRRIAALNPASPQIQYRLAMLYLATQNRDGAREALKKSLAIQPGYVDAQAALAALETISGKPEDALGIARQVQKQNPKSPVGYVMEGNALMAQKKPAPAAQAYERAFALNGNGPLLVRLHEALARAGKGAEADARVAAWLKQHPADAQVRRYLGNYKLANRDSKGAIEQFQLLLAEHPKDVAVLNNLAIAYQQSRDKRAQETAEKALELAPESPAVLDTLGWILVEQGSTGKGLPLLKKAAGLAPAAQEIRHHYALALLKSGDKAAARAELEKLAAEGQGYARLDEVKSLLKTL